MAKDELQGERLELRYVPITEVKQWDRNLKRHDMGGIIESIKRHGFKDPMKFEPELNDGEGGFVEGNGRDLAIKMMFREWVEAPEDRKPDVPRGIGLDQKGIWHIPVLFGVDAPSRAAAEAYGIDHNNLTLWGGDFDFYDVRKMYDPGFEDLLRDIIAGGGVMAGIDETLLLGLDDIDFSQFSSPINKDVLYRYVVDGLSREEAEFMVNESGKGKIETYRALEHEEV